MKVRVALMGFGRLGRNVFRAIYPRDDLEVVAINELADSRSMEYLLRYDTLRGTFDEPVRVIDDALYAQGRQIPVLHHREPGDIPWFEYGVDVVIEATGRYRTRAALEAHGAAPWIACPNSAWRNGAATLFFTTFTNFLAF